MGGGAAPAAAGIASATGGTGGVVSGGGIEPGGCSIAAGTRGSASVDHGITPTASAPGPRALPSTAATSVLNTRPGGTASASLASSP